MALSSSEKLSSSTATDLDGRTLIGGVASGVSLPVERSSDTAAVTTVNDTASNTTLLAANTSRKGFTIYNDSTVVLYVKYGTTASTASYTIQMQAGDFYESGSLIYRGRIDGIWASDASGKAVITELS